MEIVGLPPLRSPQFNDNDHNSFAAVKSLLLLNLSESNNFSERSQQSGDIPLITCKADECVDDLCRNSNRKEHNLSTEYDGHVLQYADEVCKRGQLDTVRAGSRHELSKSVPMYLGSTEGCEPTLCGSKRSYSNALIEDNLILPTLAELGGYNGNRDANIISSSGIPFSPLFIKESIHQSSAVSGGCPSTTNASSSSKRIVGVPSRKQENKKGDQCKDSKSKSERCRQRNLRIKTHSVERIARIVELLVKYRLTISAEAAN